MVLYSAVGVGFCSTNILCIPNKSSCAFSPLLMEGCAVITMSSPITRRAKFRNSNSVKISFTFSVSTSQTNKCASSKGTSTSIIIVASILETNPCASKLMTFSFCFPFKSSTFLKMFSIVPYFWINSLAVFSPIPGIPGMLSAASPHNPKISMT